MAKITWSVLAREDYWKNIDFLLKEWTEREALNFIQEVDTILNIISGNPRTFRATGYKNIYAVPVVGQITLYYSIASKNSIELVRFWNNHQDPEKLRFD